MSMAGTSVGLSCAAVRRHRDLWGFRLPGTYDLCIAASRRKSRVFWLLAGASSMGLGIWCFPLRSGMLAFRMPMECFRMSLPLSLVTARGDRRIGRGLVRHQSAKMGFWQTVTGGVFMGSGIAAMHYIGMAAMRMPARVSYNRPLVLISILLAVVISIVALVLAFRIRDAGAGQVCSRQGCQCHHYGKRPIPVLH